MKVSKHVEHLLRQGRKPKELIDLGFPKSAVTRVRRQLKEEKAAPQTKMPGGTAQAENHVQSLPGSPENMVAIWQKLQSMANDLQKVDSLAKALSEVTVLTATAQQLDAYRREICPYEKDGLCTLETWSSEDEVPQHMGEPVLVESEKSVWYVKPFPFYCAMCTAPFEGRLDDVEDKLSDNPLSGARYQITCKGCGSKGWVATRIKCTKCGRETYWGWFPKE